MRFEADEVTLLGGIRHGRTIGSPIAIEIANTEWPKWESEMSPDPGLPAKVLTQPRPGHADLSGMLKYGLDDARDVLERASARETAARVAAGTVAKLLLGQIGIDVLSHIVELGGERARARRPADVRPAARRGRVAGPVRRSRGRAPHGRGGQGRGQGRRLARRGGRGRRLRGPGRARQPRALGPPARRLPGPGAHEHPGRQGGRARRRPRTGRPAGLGGPRRHPGGRPARSWLRGRPRAGSAAATSGTPTGPEASREACRPAGRSWSGPR